MAVTPWLDLFMNWILVPEPPAVAFSNGLTGLWQVTARRNPSFGTNLVFDLEYIEN
jgi:lipopolysaccharide/colanic/teichoic acid biosynthesis glycosyltransferase